MEIRCACDEDLDAIMELVKRAVEGMQNEGLRQWNETYPNRQIISGDIASGTLFPIIIDGEIAGIIVLNESQSPEYGELKWEDTGGRYLVIHRLCIHPGLRRQGLAKQLMQFAEEYAGTKGYSSIRTDTFQENHKILAMLGSLGYEPRGKVSFGKRSGFFHCFEKRI